MHRDVKPRNNLIYKRRRPNVDSALLLTDLELADMCRLSTRYNNEGLDLLDNLLLYDLFIY